MRFLLIAPIMAMAGCATYVANIPASYVSPLVYDNLSCRQIEAEAERLASETAQATGLQQANAARDEALTAVGLLVMWPALLMTSGDGTNAAEVASLKGQMVAIEQASFDKGCNIQFGASVPRAG